MSVVYTVYREATGEVVRRLNGAPPHPVEIPAGCAWVEGEAEWGRHYIDPVTGVLMAKQPLPLAADDHFIAPDGVEVATIADIPAGVYVRWPDGDRELVEGGQVQFAATQSGRYHLVFDGVKYKKEVVTIEART